MWGRLAGAGVHCTASGAAWGAGSCAPVVPGPSSQPPLPPSNATPPTNQPSQVGRIWQQFSSVEQGQVLNIIEALAPPALPLAEGAGLTLVVEAGWEARTARSIALTFK